MTGFEPRTSGIGSNRSTNWATTTAHLKLFYRLQTRRNIYGTSPDRLITLKTKTNDPFVSIRKALLYLTIIVCRVIVTNGA